MIIETILALVVGLLPASAFANTVFNFNSVAEVARKLAAEPYRAPQPVPEFLTALSYDDYRDIRFDTKQSVWRDSGNFQIQLIHPGLYYNHAVKINLIENNVIRSVPFSSHMFTYGRNKFAEKIPADLGFAGFVSPIPSIVAMNSITSSCLPAQVIFAPWARDDVRIIDPWFGD